MKAHNGKAKHPLLDVVATIKVDGLLEEMIKEETKVSLEFNYLEMIVFIMNPLISGHRLKIQKVHIMKRLRHAIQEVPQRKPLQQPPNQVNPPRTVNKYRGRS